MPEVPTTPLETPDPIVSTEAIGAIIIAVITNVIVLFQLDLSDTQKSSIVGLVNAVVAAAVLYHGARTRAGRAIGNTQR